MSAPSNDFQAAVYKTLGAVFVGFSVACCLYGVLLSQIFGYYLQYTQDKLFYKYLVSVLNEIYRQRY